MGPEWRRTGRKVLGLQGSLGQAFLGVCAVQGRQETAGQGLCTVPGLEVPAAG
jgi:hypothetical protein